jgi:SAM-dependent methyltransferase
MDSYANSLAKTASKVFQTSYDNKERFYSLLQRLYQGQIDRNQAAQELNDYLATLRPLATGTNPGRSNERISTIAEMLQERGIGPRRILDIGAGNGEITVALKNYYRLPAQEVFAIDVKLPQIADVTQLQYVDGKIPLPDNSIDLIVAFAVLHHIDPVNRFALVQEMVRVVTPYGMIVLREHDDNGDALLYHFLDLLHVFWYIAAGETPDPLYLMTQSETSRLFRVAGAIPVTTRRYPEPNPQQIYHIGFVKREPTFDYFDESAKVRILTAARTYKARGGQLQPRDYVKELLKATQGYALLRGETYIITSTDIDRAEMSLSLT